MTPMTTTRRQFLTSTTALAAGAWLAPRFAIARSGPSANSRINLACIGVGGRGALNLQGLAGENIVALCDVDDQNATEGIRYVKEWVDAGVQRGILDNQTPPADRVESRMTERRAADDVAPGNAHVDVHPGENAVLDQDVFHEIGGAPPPAAAVVDVVPHPAVDHAEVHHKVGPLSVGAHGDGFARAADF